MGLLHNYAAALLLELVLLQRLQVLYLLGFDDWGLTEVVVLVALSLHLAPVVLRRVSVERLVSIRLVLEIAHLLVWGRPGDLVSLRCEGRLKLVDLGGVSDHLALDLGHDLFLLLGNVLLPLVLSLRSLATFRRARDLRPWHQLRRKSLQVIFIRVPFQFGVAAPIDLLLLRCQHLFVD